MKKYILISLLLSASLLTPTIAQDHMDIGDSYAVLQPKPNQQTNAPRVTFYFDCEAFLKTYSEQFSSTLGLILSNPLQRNLTDDCWRALFKLKDHYKQQNDYQNYGVTYMSMANLFLAYGELPLPYRKSSTDEERKKQKRFYLDLIETIRQKVLEKCEDKQNQLYKWALIYLSRLSSDYVRAFPKTHRRDLLLNDAWNSLDSVVTRF